MEYIIIIFVVPITVGVLVFAIRNIIRSERVYAFRKYVNDRTYDYSIRTGINGYPKYYERLPSYAKMVHSVKPLKLETYFTEHEIIELLNL